MGKCLAETLGSKLVERLEEKRAAELLRQRIALAIQRVECCCYDEDSKSSKSLEGVFYVLKIIEC